MKTTNKIQKTVLTAALAVGFSIFSLSIDAQVESNPLPKNNPANNLAMANLNSSNRSSTATFNEVGPTTVSTIVTYLITETEAPLNVEKWMLDDSNFSSVDLIESEIETPLQIEAWMIDDNIFEVNSNPGSLNNSEFSGGYIFINNISFPAVIVEKNIQLEDWMTNSKIWK